MKLHFGITSNMEIPSELTAGKAVRLVNSPGETGSLTGRRRERAGTIHWQVRFTDQLTYQPEFELELVTDEKEDYEDLIQSGRFGDVTDLRRNHGTNNGLSPEEMEKQYFMKLQGV